MLSCYPRFLYELGFQVLLETSHTFNYSVVVHLGDAAMVAAYRLVEELMMPFEFSVAQSRAQHANSHNPNGIIKNLLVGRFLLFSVNNIAVYKL